MLTAQADQPSALSGSVAHPFLSTRAASPLKGLRGSRAVLLADRLHRSPLQVMAHRILPSTGHEVPRAARVSPKRSRQSFWLSPRPQQGQERIPDPDLQREQGITHLVRQDSRGLGQERPQSCRMRYVPLPRGNWPIRSVDWVSGLRGLDGTHRSAGRVAGWLHA